MTQWLRYERDGQVGFGTLQDGVIAVHQGDMFSGATPTGATVKLSEVRLRTPCDPSKMICLWNNFHQLAAKNNFLVPDEPLYFLKAPNAYHPAGAPIERPKTYGGRILYEGELGVVIGRKCANVSEAEAQDYIFGYTCVNDVTAVDLLKKNPSFDQWRGRRASTRSGFSARRSPPAWPRRACASAPCSTARRCRTIRSPTCSSRPTSWWRRCPGT
jgi:2-keto-4-pentenoate hydratase/2-oxohepta-3-ene-1,7-dioic acid hydratase in catechol pathway